MIAPVGALEIFDPAERLSRIGDVLDIEIEKLNMDRTIQSRVKRQMERAQKEYYLNEKIKAIQKELGRGEKDSLWSGSVEIFNGLLRSAKPWGFQSGDTFEGPNHWQFRTGGRPKGLILDLNAADTAPPGSQDVTIVTIKANASTPSSLAASSLRTHRRKGLPRR